MKQLYIVLAAMLLLGIPTYSFAGKKSYPIVCRGGGGMHAVIGVYRKGKSRIIFDYKKASHGASHKKPGPGECAFLDRPISNNEPRLLHYFYKRHALVNTVTVRHKNFSVSYNKNRPEQKILDALHSGGLFYMHIRQRKGVGGARYFQVTRLGP